MEAKPRYRFALPHGCTYKVSFMDHNRSLCIMTSSLNNLHCKHYIWKGIYGHTTCKLIVYISHRYSDDTVYRLHLQPVDAYESQSQL